jgi:hypothetical protein
MSDSSHKAIVDHQTRPIRRVFALLALAALTGCNAVYAGLLPPAPPSRVFIGMSCDQLGKEKVRIERGYLEHNARMKVGTKKALSQLNGDALAVNDAAKTHGCNMESVRELKTPTRYPPR